jgi:CDP-6-deoxy-D-xylo-4-hexulose-3-dehydrase
VLFNSGGSANLGIVQALVNLGRLRRGDRVGFSAITWSTNVMPLLQMGLQPVPLDIDPATLNAMSAEIEAAHRRHGLAAVFLTNALGFCGDLPRIAERCRDLGLLLLEDNCEALGSEMPEGRTGGFGAASTYSFFVAHHMSTIEGGAACTDDPELGEMLRIVRANGWDRNLTAEQQARWRSRHGIRDEMRAKYAFYDLGYNLRPTEITGFLGLRQLNYLEENIRLRGTHFARLEQGLRANPDFLPQRRDHIRVLSPFAFPVVCRSQPLFEHYRRVFERAGVEIRPIISGNIQNQPFYRRYVTARVDLPQADFLDQCGFYFGIYPELGEEDLRLLLECLA